MCVCGGAAAREGRWCRDWCWSSGFIQRGVAAVIELGAEAMEVDLICRISVTSLVPVEWGTNVGYVQRRTSVHTAGLPLGDESVSAGYSKFTFMAADWPSYSIVAEVIGAWWRSKIH